MKSTALLRWLNRGWLREFLCVAGACGVWVMLAGGVAAAGQVEWGSERLATNVTSAGAPLGEDFRFELGGFEAGFVPVAENVAEWRAHWVVVGSAEYHPAAGFFAASTAVGGLPGTVGRAAYIWGFNVEDITGGGAGRAEWILVTHAEWQLPAGGSVIAPPLQWSTGTATTAIVGSVNAEPGIHLRTASMGANPATSPAASPAGAWLAYHGFEHSVDSQIWERDSDGDGVSNLMEYATGTHPRSAGSVSREILRVGMRDNGRSITLTFDKNPEARVQLNIETSSDLEQWQDVEEVSEGMSEVVSDAVGRVTIRASLPVDVARSRFFRLSASLLP